MKPKGLRSSPPVRGFRDHDAVQRPDRIELQLLRKVREIDEFADGYLVAKVRKIKREFHRSRPPFIALQASRLVLVRCGERLQTRGDGPEIR